MLPSLDGRRFRSVAEVRGGDVGAETVFHYAEVDGVIHARYMGGKVRLGFLVGVRDGQQLNFRYSQLRVDGTTASGHCRSTVLQLPDGRIRLEEHWEWESQPGSGTSAVEELAPDCT